MNMTAFLLFLAIVGLTLIITYFAAKKTKTTSEFYTAGGGLTGVQNGLAIAGDYMSAASFLGIAGMIALYGFDGFFYSIGFLVAYLVVLYIVAEPLRNLGKYTMADMIAARFKEKENPRRRGSQYHCHLYFLYDRPARGSGRADQTAAWAGLYRGRPYCRSADDHLCRVWRHDRDKLGSNY